MQKRKDAHSLLEYFNEDLFASTHTKSPRLIFRIQQFINISRTLYIKVSFCIFQFLESVRIIYNIKSICKTYWIIFYQRLSQLIHRPIN